MLTIGTIAGIGTSLFIAWAFVATVRWQRKLGGFWPYSILFAILGTFLVLATFAEFRRLTDSSLREMHAEQPRYNEPIPLDEFRSREVSRANSLLLVNGGIIGVVALAIAALCSRKAARLKQGMAQAVG